MFAQRGGHGAQPPPPYQPADALRFTRATPDALPAAFSGSSQVLTVAS
jgi:hypothetical protein